MDNDSTVLDDCAASVTLIDKKYRRARPVDRIKLKPDRDRAFNAYRRARLKLLEDGTLATAADVRKMKEIRQEIGRARATQTIIAGAIKLVAFAAKFA
jgi:hypothetical protein